jgi:hypothetical protein
MKNLLSIAALLVAFSSSAADPVLSKSESTQIVSYLSDICPDTYCGGDYNYYPQTIECNESSCTLSMKLIAYYEGDLADAGKGIGQSSSDANAKVTLIDVGMQEEWSMDSETVVLMHSVDFTCVINNLSKNNASLDSKIDKFYDYTVGSCVPMMEDLL